MKKKGLRRSGGWCTWNDAGAEDADAGEGGVRRVFGNEQADAGFAAFAVFGGDTE